MENIRTKLYGLAGCARAHESSIISMLGRARNCILLLLPCIPFALSASAGMSIPLGSKGVEFPRKSNSDTSAWTRVSCEVPAAWKGRRVVFSVPWGLNKCDLVLNVNGERAGDVLRPAGRLDVTDKLRFGAANEFAWVLTESGRLTARGEAKTVAKLHHARKGLSRAPELLSVAPVSISDVFANTSWRRRRCDFVRGRSFYRHFRSLRNRPGSS